MIVNFKVCIFTITYTLQLTVSLQLTFLFLFLLFIKINLCNLPRNLWGSGAHVHEDQPSYSH